MSDVPRQPIVDGVVRAIVEHADREAPRECCGLLGGRKGRIVAHAPLPNVSPRPEREYFAEPRALVTALRTFRKRGIDLLGIYHSHPASPPRPSATDIERAYYPHCVYVIIGPRDVSPRLEAFRLVAGRSHRVVLDMT